MNSFRTFRPLTVISVVHMDVHADTQVSVVGSFSFACHTTTRQYRRKRKPVKHQFSPNLKFWFVVFGMLNVQFVIFG